jgi:hypothetical protein
MECSVDRQHPSVCFPTTYSIFVSGLQSSACSKSTALVLFGFILRNAPEFSGMLSVAKQKINVANKDRSIINIM